MVSFEGKGYLLLSAESFSLFPNLFLSKLTPSWLLELHFQNTKLLSSLDLNNGPTHFAQSIGQWPQDLLSSVVKDAAL